MKIIVLIFAICVLSNDAYSQCIHLFRCSSCNANTRGSSSPNSGSGCSGNNYNGHNYRDQGIDDPECERQLTIKNAAEKKKREAEEKLCEASKVKTYKGGTVKYNYCPSGKPKEVEYANGIYETYYETGVLKSKITPFPNNIKLQELYSKEGKLEEKAKILRDENYNQWYIGECYFKSYYDSKNGNCENCTVTFSDKGKYLGVGTLKDVEVFKVGAVEKVNSSNIKFNIDSYILQNESKIILDEFVNGILKYNQTNLNNQITDIYITTHGHFSGDDSKQLKVMFFISLNRAVATRKYLESKGLRINYHLIPCSHLLPKGSNALVNRRVEIYTDNNPIVQKAKEAYKSLSKIYNTVEINGEYPQNKILINTQLRENIVYNIKLYLGDPVNYIKTWIPLELWYPEYSKEEEGLEEFIIVLEDLIKEKRGNYSGFVYEKK